MLDARLAEYLRGLISNEEVIKELLKMAQELKANAEQASELGLTEEEQAFYDALTKPQAVRDFYENDQLVAMAKELKPYAVVKPLIGDRKNQLVPRCALW